MGKLPHIPHNYLLHDLFQFFLAFVLGVLVWNCEVWTAIFNASAYNFCCLETRNVVSFWFSVMDFLIFWIMIKWSCLLGKNHLVFFGCYMQPDLDIPKINNDNINNHNEYYFRFCSQRGISWYSNHVMFYIMVFESRIGCYIYYAL